MVELDLLRDMFSVIREYVPDAEERMDLWIEQGEYSTLEEVRMRRTDLVKLLNDYYKAVREQSTRPVQGRYYFKQGAQGFDRRKQ